jgi:acyl-CoA reductase-like NAD-dependent aldehyde dehydrogenase
MECGVVVINGSGNYCFDRQLAGGYKKGSIGHKRGSRILEKMSPIKTVVLKKQL